MDVPSVLQPLAKLARDLSEVLAMTPNRDLLLRQGSTAEMWRCRDCGKWSHAKRRPKQHKRWVATGDADTDYGHVAYGHFVWCGPFDRFEARHSDHATPPALRDLNEIAPDSANNDGQGDPEWTPRASEVAF